jgi:hypothetical protein
VTSDQFHSLTRFSNHVSVVVISPIRAVAAIPYPLSCGERCGFDRAIVIARFSVDAFTEALHNRECQQTHTHTKKKKKKLGRWISVRSSRFHNAPP